TALRDAQTRVEERDLRFGPVATGVDAGTRAIRLFGPPLARACTALPSHDWIRTTETADGFLVSVDTHRAGTHRGSVTLRSSLNEAVVAVELDVAAGPAPETRPAAESRPAAETPPRVVPEPEPMRERAVSRPGATVRDNWWARVMAYEMVAAGLVMFVLGVVLLSARGDGSKVSAVTALCFVYGAHWLVVAGVPGESRGARRVLSTVIGLATVLVGASLLWARPAELAYWNIRESLLVGFWLVTGPLEIGAVAAGAERPTRRAEWATGALTTIAGVVLVVLVLGELEGSLAPVFGLYGVGVGAVWAAIGLLRHRNGPSASIASTGPWVRT
ncbi:MAG TPA: hypothetical protein VF657_09750, partial [Actinoplanes sp.]